MFWVSFNVKSGFVTELTKKAVPNGTVTKVSQKPCFVGRDGALVESITFNRGVVGSTPALPVMYGPWASPLPAVACALRREIPIQYPCCSREHL